MQEATHTAFPPSLQAVRTLIRAGNPDGAYRKLMELAKHSGAAGRIGYFVELSLLLRKPDIVEALLSDALPRSVRVSVALALADVYRQLGDRPSAYRKLVDLSQACADSPDDLRRIAHHFVRLGECSVALEIRERLLQAAPRDYLLALDVIELRMVSTSKRAAAFNYLNKIMGAADVPSTAWLRAAQLYRKFGDRRAALRSVRKAIELDESRTEARQLLADILMHSGRRRSARKELAILLVESGHDPSRLRALGDMAFSLPDRKLAGKFAEAQFQIEPTNPECILYLARYLRVLGERSRAQQLLSSLFDAERQSLTISDKQLVRLAQELFDVGDLTLTKQAIGEVVARGATNAVTRDLSAAIALLERSGSRSSSTVRRENCQERVRLRLATRLLKMFGR
jgi:tetratricopeptide (TPR) repeat protein